MVCAIIDEETVPAARIGGNVHPLPAVGDEEIKIAIIVEIDENAPVVAAHVRGRRSGEIHIVIVGQ